MKKSACVPVLMYHHVSPVPDGITTSPERFDEQLGALRKAGYGTLTVAQFEAFMQGGEVPDKSVLLTFDDGYLDNWVYAQPILAKHGMQAVLFLVTGWAKEGEPRPQMGAGQGVPVVPSHTDCMARVRAGEDTDAFVVRWSEALLMEQAGFEVHSHTHTHTRWDKQAGSREEKRTRILAELAESKRTLEARLGRVEEHVCWPQGYFDDDYKAAARQAGYRYFYTTEQFGFNRPLGDTGHIYRIPISNRSGAWVVRRVNLARNPVLGPLFNAFKKWKRSLRRR